MATRYPKPKYIERPLTEKETQARSLIRDVARDIRGIELTDEQIHRAYMICRKSPAGSILEGQDFYDRVKEYFKS